MRIKSMNLRRYKRLLLNNIQEFSIDLESPYQIVIGTNGSGKSSMLFELSPLPPIPANYEKGGGKVIKIEDEGKHYTLASDFAQGGSGKHSFILEDENGDFIKEFNDGGTLTVQRELVKTIFKYTQEIHSLLIGEETFTNMSPLQRRGWIVAISHNDLDYAIDAFNKLKGVHRDNAGAIKHISQRLTDAVGKATDDANITKMENEIDLIQKELTLLMEERDPSVPSISVDMEKRVGEILQSVDSFSGRILKLSTERPAMLVGEPLNDIYDIDQKISAVREGIAVHNQALASIQDEYQRLQELVATIRQVGGTGIDDIEGQIVNLKTKKEHLLSTITVFHDLEINEKTSFETNECEKHLTEVVMNLKGNEDGKYSREKLDGEKVTVDKMRDALARASAELTKIDHRIRHIKTSDANMCPKCGYHWVDGVSPQELAALEEKSKSIQVYITDVTTKMETHLLYIAEVEDYQFQLRNFKRLTQSYSLLGVFWRKVIDERVYITAPNRIMNLFVKWKDDLSIHEQVDKINREIRDCNYALRAANALSQADTTGIDNRLLEMEEKIEKHTSTVVEETQRLRVVEAYRKNIDLIIRLGQECQLVVEKAERDLALMIKSAKNAQLVRDIKESQIQLASLNDLLISATVAKDLVKDLSKDMDNLDRDKMALAILIKELSPADGMIAEQLSDVNKCLIDQMNKIIAHIWTYQMQVLPCGVDSGELDFKFPFNAKRDDNIIPDISKGSAGQRDIIDFAFKLVVMMYMGLDNHPLFLDELAPTLDEQHRINIMRFIKELVETHQVPQLVLISHYYTNHGAFNNAQICVMDSSNILQMPVEYNKHVVMR